MKRAAVDGPNSVAEFDVHFCTRVNSQVREQDNSTILKCCHDDLGGSPTDALTRKMATTASSTSFDLRLDIHFGTASSDQSAVDLWTQ